MRRLIVVSVLLAVGGIGLSGCTSSSGSTVHTSSTAASGSGDGGTSGGGSSTAKATVCAQLGKVVPTDMGPVGTALGAYVGAAVAGSTSGKAAAKTKLTTAVTKLGSDLSTTAAAGGDPAVKAGAAQSAKNLTAVVSDPAFLNDVTSMSDISTVTTTLQTAVAPVTKACEGS